MQFHDIYINVRHFNISMIYNTYVYNFQKLIHSSRVLTNDNSLMENSVKDMTYLPVGVYYEALCPDSRNFILQHLVPSFNKAPNSFSIEFVPYGKAKVIVK